MRVPAQLKGVCELFWHELRKIVNHLSVAVVPWERDKDYSGCPYMSHGWCFVLKPSRYPDERTW